MPRIEGIDVSPIVRPRRDAARTYNRLSGVYDTLAASSEDRFLERGVELLDLRKGERVLEIGSGTGRGLVRLTEQVGSEGRVVGADLSPGMVDRARRRLALSGLNERVGLLVGDAVQLPLAENTQDAAFVSFTLELFSIDDLDRVLAELSRVLRENGRLAVVSLNKSQEMGWAGRFYELLHTWAPGWVDCRPIPVLPILRQAGWMIDRHETAAMWGLPVSLTLARNAVNRTGK